MRVRPCHLPAALLAAAAILSGSSAAQPGGSLRPQAAGHLFRDIAQQQSPSVVSITTRRRNHDWTPGEEDVFRLFGVTPPPAVDRLQRSIASGIIISTAGDILTNSHVIENADAIDVGLFGRERQRYRAVRVGTDPLTDTALIRLENPPPGLRPAVLGDSSAVRPGDWVMAIGNPFQLGHSVTVGVVSFDHRRFSSDEGPWEDLIQTDASINPGNSGGPLIDSHGEVVGVNVAILDPGEAAPSGIGFAVPINTIKALLPQLRAGKVVRAYLDVELHEEPILDDEAHELGLPEAVGALVKSVDEESPAWRGGLRAGDVIVEVAGHAIADARDLAVRVSGQTPGTTIRVKLFRDGVPQVRMITVEELTFGEHREAPRAKPDRNGGLTLDSVTASDAGVLGTPAGLDGALVVEVAPGSAAEEAELSVGDIIRRINRRPVRTAADAKNELKRIDLSRPLFVLVWRDGTELLLRMRRD